MSALLIFIEATSLFAQQPDPGDNAYRILMRGQKQLYDRLCFLDEMEIIPFELYSPQTLADLQAAYAPDSPELAWEFEDVFETEMVPEEEPGLSEASGRPEEEAEPEEEPGLSEASGRPEEETEPEETFTMINLADLFETEAGKSVGTSLSDLFEAETHLSARTEGSNHSAEEMETPAQTGTDVQMSGGRQAASKPESETDRKKEEEGASAPETDRKKEEETAPSPETETERAGETLPEPETESLPEEASEAVPEKETDSRMAQTESAPQIRWGVKVLEDGTGSLFVVSFEGGSWPLQADVPDKVGGITVTQIAQGCFSGLQDVLAGVTLPDTIRMIETGAFEGCKELRKISIPASVQEIGDGAFEGTGIRWFSVDPGQTVFWEQDGVLFTRESAELVAYPSGNRRNSYDIPEGTKAIRPEAFAGNQFLKSCSLPSSLVELAPGAFAGSRIQKFVTAENSSVYKSINGVLFRKSSGETAEILAAYPPGREQEYYSVLRTVHSIEDQAFAGCTFLKRVVLHQGLIRLGNGAFAGCSALESIRVPDTVLDMGWYVFSGCTQLKEAVLSSSVLIVEEGVFYGCRSLEKVELPVGCVVLDHLPEGCIVHSVLPDDGATQ